MLFPGLDRPKKIWQESPVEKRGKMATLPGYRNAFKPSIVGNGALELEIPRLNVNTSKMDSSFTLIALHHQSLFLGPLIL